MISTLRSTHDLRQTDQTRMLTHHTILTNPKCKITIDSKRSQEIQIIDPKSIEIEFIIPSGNSLQTPISIVVILNFQLSLTKWNAPYMFSKHFTQEKQHRMSRPMNVSSTHQLNGTLFQMTSRKI